MRSRGIDIPPGDSHYVIRAGKPSRYRPTCGCWRSFRTWNNLGCEMKVTAFTPDGKQVPMIWICDWDFNWQGSHQYQKP